MAMAATVPNTAETKAQAPRPRATRPLALASVAGAAFVVVGAAAIFYGIPRLWSAVVGSALDIGYVDDALLGLLMLGSAAGLAYVGRQLVGAQPPVGLRAGIVVVIVAALTAAGVALGVGRFLEARGWLAQTPNVGLALTAAVFVVLLGLVVRWIARPKGEAFLVGLEDQGWFHWHFYKRTQGLRVRRLTILGLLILFGFGIWSLYTSSYLQAGAADWTVTVPFTGTTLVLIRDLKYALPFLILAPLAVWFAFRVVNYPVFADFLVATEAELNKVSWTPKKQLWRDTVVVLITVFLFTVFLFFVDQVWGWTFRTIGVLPKVNPADTTNQPTKVHERKY
jgi:preprotein translocase SecE subunit